MVTITDPQVVLTLRLALRRDIRELRRLTRNCREDGTPSPFLEEELERAEEAYKVLDAVA